MKHFSVKFNRIARILSWFTGGIVCVLILNLIFAAKGCFPFGDGSVAIMDMCHGYVPVYYHLYDFLHGDKALFFDWYTGTGVNMVGIAAVNGLLSPLNLLFYFVPRDGIVSFMDIFLVVKVFLAAVSAQFFFKKRFSRLPEVYACVFSVLYALSGYVMLYYLHIIWLDVAIVFPLLIYFGERALNGGKLLPFSLCVFLSLLGSFYLGVMAVVCVFFIGGAYIFIIPDKKERPLAAARLGLGTAIGALLPTFVILPGYLQMRASSRYAYTGGFSDILSAAPELNLYKTLMFGGLQLAFLLALLFVFRYRKHRNASLFALLSLLILYLPFAIEGSAMLWHFGSYKDFPYRFGFASIFFVLAFAAAAIDRDGDGLRLQTPARPGKGAAIAEWLIAAVCVAALAYANSRLYADDGTVDRFDEKRVFALSLILFAAGVLAFSALLRLRRTAIRRAAVFAVCVAQIIPFGFLSIGVGSPIRYERREHDVAYIEPALAVSALSQIDNTRLERMHNPDMSLNINYGLVMGKGALSNWTHQIPAALQNARRALGYSTTYTLLLDGGGTVFSDAALHMTETVSKEALDERLYAKTGAVGEYTLYANLFTLPNVLFADSADMGFRTVVATGADIFENQNRMYAALGGDGALIRTPQNDPQMLLASARADNTVKYELTAGQNEALYFSAPAAAWNSMTVFVNDVEIKAPSYHREENAYYASEYNNNCLTLGVFDRETVTVELLLYNDGADPGADAFGFLSLGKMESLNEYQCGLRATLTAGKRSVSVQAEAVEKDGYVILPVSYDAGWSARVDGAAAVVEPAAGYLCAVRVPAGASQITLRFTPSGLQYGVALSALGLLAAAGAAVAERKNRRLRIAPVLGRLALYGLFILWIAAVFAVYALPLVSAAAQAIRSFF